MKIGILKTGQPPAELQGVPSYPEMVRASLGGEYSYRDFDVAAGELPGADADVDGFVITGSAAGAYEPDAWIGAFIGWLRELPPETPLVGICFGHQIMAQAYGGAVERARNGWALGLHEYDVTSREGWMDDARAFAIPVSHRDQVVKLPPSGRVVASSDFCSCAALAYDDRRAISFQGHPEFPLDYAATLVELRQRKGLIDGAHAGRARESLAKPDDRARVNAWIRRFLES